MTVSQLCLLNITVTSPWLHSCTAPPTFREKSLQSLWLSQHEPWLTKDKPLTKSKKPGLPISLLTNGKCKSIYKCTAVNCSMVVTLNNPLQVSSLRYSCAQCHPYNSCFAVNHIRNWSHLMQTKPIYIYLKRKKKKNCVTFCPVSYPLQFTPASLHYPSFATEWLLSEITTSWLPQLLNTAVTWQFRKQRGTSPHQPNQHNSYSKFSPGIRAKKQSAQYEEGKEPVSEILSSLALAFEKEPLSS